MRPINPRILAYLTAIAFLTALGAHAATGPSLVLKLPEGAAIPKSAVALARDLKLDLTGKVDATARTITFEKLLPDTEYDVALTLDDGTLLQGVNMAWYGMDPAKPDTQALSEEDQKAILEMIDLVKTFENKKRAMIASGDSNRVTVLVELIRDSEFHAAGGNIIWRAELWYFKNQFGGFAKVQQQNKVLRRERFKDQAAFDAVVSKIRWVAELGGLKVEKGKDRAEIKLPALTNHSGVGPVESAPKGGSAGTGKDSR